MATEVELAREETFTRREWRVESLGWALLTLVVLIALVGLLGRGPYSTSERTSPDGSVTVSFQRIAHLDADETLVVSVAPGAVADDQVQVLVQGTWPDDVEIRGITPQPADQAAAPGALQTTVAAVPGQPVQVNFQVRASAPGWVEGRVSAGGREAVFQQLVLP